MQHSDDNKQPIPVHVITGFLGSGKSSLIRHLVAHKPAGERWAIVINEFGQVGIDQAMFESRDDVVVKGLPGGCLCCQLAFVLQAALVNLIRRERPDRLIVEPSGLGHPAGLLDMLRGEAFESVLDVREIVTLLDPRRLDDPRAREHETFRDQLLMADAVALTMTDLSTAAQRCEAYRYVDAMWPPKRWVDEAPHGRLSPSLLLGAPATSLSQAGTAVSTHHQPPPTVTLDEYAYREPAPGRPCLETGESLGHASLGWRWHVADTFSLDALTQLLDGLDRDLRVKAVWHTDAGWWLFNRSNGRSELSPTAWRRDSRLELIGEAGTLPDPQALEARLAACQLTAETQA
ncbi:GTPase, G3E family [Franzmannia pantelleriensis]|uniref:GTPase, G3E family n=1 Tax=Franzmannia pantelleriensis TaxID=48727 RepID=A0A1G9MIU2_9GAMM|nr:GTP-binding protein [Halomonas pantelleriensis]SDL74129.1 GTPase, G3E family [Halomonas pantelleriensis]